MRKSILLLYICIVVFAIYPRTIFAAIEYPDTGFVELSGYSYQLKEGKPLPYYHAQIELDSENYGVKITYPEYVSLNQQEKQIVRKLNAVFQEEPIIETVFSRSRKKTWLEYRFCPIVKRGGKWMKLVSCKISIVPKETAIRNALLLKSTEKTQRYVENSVLFKGKWAKIRVSKEGVYELTHSQLASWGFKNPEKVKLYGYGGLIQNEELVFSGENQVIDDLNEVPLYRKSNSLLFFAEGVIRWSWNRSSNKWIHQLNPYSNYSYYFVTEGDNPLKIEKKSNTSSVEGTLVESVMHHAVLDDDKFSWYEGGREFYDGYDFQTGNARTFQIETPGLVEKESAIVDVAFSAASINKATNVNVDINSKLLGSFSVPTYGERENAREVRKTFRTNHLSKQNAFKFTTTAGNSARLNYIRISYLRKLDATTAPFAFTANTAGATTFSVAGANKSTQVWQLGNSQQPMMELEAKITGDNLRFYTDSPSKRFVVVDVNANYPAPEFVSEVANQNLHADSNLDMIIIVPANGKLMAEAERLAQAHRENGQLRIKIISADKIYNEFSSGTPDATAYRRYLKMLYDKATTENDLPRYLLLFGDCLWDNRLVTKNWGNLSADDLLLSYERNNSENSIGTIHCYVTDDYFGLLEDGKGINITSEKVDIGIGRFTCTTSEDAKIFVDKTIRYMHNEDVGVWKNTICMLGDNGDNNEHMIDAENVVKQINNVSGKNLGIKKLYWDAYPQTMTATGVSFPQVSLMVKEQMKKGAIMFNYSGHGSPDQISHSKILFTDDFREPTVGLPIWVFASCEITPYDTQTDNIGRAAMLNKNGGAIALMCAARAVYADQNNQLNMAFSKYILGNDNTGKRYTFGDAMRMAKVSMLTMGADRTMNKLKYLLIGDPALTLSIPTYKVVLDSINGELLTADSYKKLQAGQLVRFSGHISKIDGTCNEEFSGILNAKITDKEETIVCKKNDSTTDKPMEYKDRPKVIYEGADSVRNGKFVLNVLIPRDIAYSNSCANISFYAVNSKKNMEANGHNEQFYLNGTYQGAEIDEQSPETYIYLNSPDFPDGGITDPNPVFVAEIKDNQGINTIDNIIGHDIELVLDNDISNIYKLNNYFTYDFGSYKEGRVNYQLQGLAPGKHTLSFRVWDINNNSTSAYLNFIVKENIKDKIDVNATKNPARTSTHIITSFRSGDEVTKVTTEVYDISGRMIWSNTSSTPSGSNYNSVEWRLVDNNGAPIPAGIYLYRSKISSESYNADSKTKKIIVVRQ